MVLIRTVLFNAFATSVLIGALRQTDALEVHPQNIENEWMRLAFIKSVAFGEVVWHSVQNAANNIGKDKDQ